MDIEESEKYNNHIRIIEFFRNDPLVIRDFLATSLDTAWDFPFMYKYKLSKEELIEQKKMLLDDIIVCYYDYQYEDEFDKNASNLNKKSVNELDYLFFCDDNYTIKLIKHFIDYLNTVEDINLNTYNYFKNNIINLMEIYKSEVELMGLDKIDRNNKSFYDVFQKAYSVFSKDLFDCIKQYIEVKLEPDEEQKFINYLFSLTYAYIKFSEETGEELDKNDRDFLELVKSDIDLTEFFYRYPVVAVFVIECVNDLIEEYKENYDLRKNIDDEDSLEVFKKLDDNFDDEFDADIVINNICLDIKLEQIMAFFKARDILPGVGFGENLTNQAIIDILDDKYSLYEPLVTVCLDGRYEGEYKKLLIRKIVADCYEYLSYLVTLDDKSSFIDSYDEVILEEIKGMKIEWKNIYSVFYTYADELLDIWYRYNNEDINYHTKACLNCKKSGDINRIISIYYYAIYRYTKNNNIKELKSVDLMNDIIEKLESNSLSEEDTALSDIMCLNVYERTLDDKEQDGIVKFLSKEENVNTYFKSNKEKYNELVRIFKRLNKRKISYIEENRLRKKITDKEHVKVIKKLNRYNEDI